MDLGTSVPFLSKRQTRLTWSHCLMRVTQFARTNSWEALLHQGVIRTNCLPTKCDIWESLCLLQLLYPFQWQTHSPPYWGQCSFPFLPWTVLNFHTGMTDLPIYPVVAGLATIESKIECMKNYVVPLFWGTSLTHSWAWVLQTQHQYILHQSNEIFPWAHCKDCTKCWPN